MKVLVQYLTRKSRGGVAVKEQPVEAEVLTIGRGNDCGVHLADPRVLLHHAEMSLRSGEIYVAPAAPGAGVRLNGNLTQMTRVAIGDKIAVGPFELVVVDNDHENHIAVTVELVMPLADDLTRITEQSRIRTGGLSVRAFSWALGLGTAALLFVAPFAASWFHDRPDLRDILNSHDRLAPSAPTEIWSSGGISASHRFFGDSCETCHVTPFVPVTDATCLTCHEKTEHHADPVRFGFASFADRSCQSCHKEHQGAKTIALSDQAFCADCHGGFKARAPASDLQAVSDFGRDHPEFKPTVVTDASIHAVDRSKTVSAIPPPREDSALRFPHNRHLRPSGVRDPGRGNIQLNCADCHRSDGAGYMQPISFQENCHRCHTLKFDSFIPDRELVHGRPEELMKQVHDIYDAVAMRGGYEEPAAPALIRRRVGTSLTPVQKKEALDWSAEKTRSLLAGRFGRGLCAGCHETFDVPAGSDVGPGWNVLPVTASALWYPKARFSHERHRDMDCVSCHDATNAVEAAEVLMPGIESCRTCHGGEKAADKVPSTCISCHGFHRPELEPMKAARPGKTASAAHRTMMAALSGPAGARR